MESKRSELIGRYILKKHGTYDLNDAFSPTSTNMAGELNYSSDGTMSVLILFKEIVESSRDILAYVGRFELITPNEVHHHISLCSQQGRNNQTEVRSLKITSAGITLGCQLPGGSRFEAEWEKIE